MKTKYFPAIAHALLILNLFFGQEIFGQTVLTNPASPWTVPAGVFSVKVEVWGGGGAGGGATGSFGTNIGSGGGGGAYNIATFSVLPGQTYTIVRGSGGTGVSAGTGNPGTLSQVAGTGGSVTANPGTGGAANGGAAGTGGTGFNKGGNGGVGSSNGAGGGGGAGNATPTGTTGNGGNGSNTAAGAGGAGTLGGGAGGLIQNASNNGSTGSSPAGGGGGAFVNFATAKTGGAGAAGQVVLTFTVCPTIAASATKNDAQCFNTSTGQIVVSGSGGSSPYTFSINNGATYQSASTFTNLSAGNYQIRVKDNNGCQSNSVQ